MPAKKTAAKSRVREAVRKAVYIARSTLSNVASSASTGTLAAANLNRRGLIIFNDSTADLYIKYGAAASLTSFSYKVPTGGTFEMQDGSVYTGVVDGIWSAANGNARVTELD